MSYINISHTARQALKAIDESELESRIDKCLYEEQSHYLMGLRLSDCGPYVMQQLYDFEKAVTALRAAKSNKREEAKSSATRAGCDLAFAVSKMKEQVSIIEFDELTFAVELPNASAMALNEYLSVRVSYSWRTDQNAVWQYGHITFTYLAKEEPDYFSVVPVRKVSKARQQQEEQDRLVFPAPSTSEKMRRWVFPASAGINRRVISRAITCISVPRASGDKPNDGVSPVVSMPCSPRQRG